MSDLNVDFLVDNFYDKKINFFNIGCSDLGDTIDFKNYLPNAKFYAFDVFYESGTSYEDFDNLLYGYGYTKLYSTNNDAMYIHNSFKKVNKKYI